MSTLTDRLPDISMDANALYREEMITDRRMGVLRVLHPIKADGSPDAARATVFSGEAQLATSIGALPISFDIPATTFEEAIAAYSAASKAALERTMQELQELRRQAASSLVIPPSGSHLGGGMGGLGGGGKIQMP
ncbi:MAG: hypothetical protein FWC38_04740 [Proteobacteria bacterium]|nr:hypothetical protein [Pseudomonadota bacterium]MCL2307526.1 hypothetical protein [Pseudomonadota bacterium]